MAGFSVACFGSLAFYRDGLLLHIPNQKARELLALLLSEFGRPLRKSQAAELLWPETDSEHAMDSLYKVCGTIRRLGQAEAALPLESRRDALWLDLGRLDSDVARFRRLYRSREEIACCLAAIELYTAPFLINECYEWSAAAEAYYDIRYLELLSLAERHYRAQGDQAKAAYYAQLADS